MSRAPGTGYCNTCKTRVPIHWEDIGIGAYEFWGARGTHHDWIAICPECGDDLESCNHSTEESSHFVTKGDSE